VWLLRHGASTFNLQHRCQGCSNEPELTAQGREEARLSAEHLASKDIHAVITSPLRRACDTAGELVKVLRGKNGTVLFKTDACLREIELYHWEGLPLNEIRRRFPEQYCQWRLHPASFRMQVTDNEVRFPVCDLYHRIRSFWDYLLTAHFGKSVLLVSHSGTIRSLIGAALDLGPAHFHSFQQSNCGLSRLRFPSGSRRAKLDLLNDTAHLRGRLPKLKEGRCGVRLLFIAVLEVNVEAIRNLAATLDGVVIEHVVTVGAAAREVASQLFPSSSDSCIAVSEAMASTALDQLIQQYSQPYSQQHSEARLRHLALLGPLEILRRILQQQLHIFDTAAESLVLNPLQITPVHLPGNGIPPVLQSMNMSNRAPELRGA
jgi:probable phosphoglycerate mutase